MSEKCKPCIMTDDGQNLSVAWARAFLSAMHPHRANLTPLMLRVEDFTEGVLVEDNIIRSKLEKYLEVSCHTVANTIFPLSLWNRDRSRDELYKRYTKILPLIKRCRKNSNGIYFERLVAYDNHGEPYNQLEHIIQTFIGGNHRPSALQASVFDPTKDHTNQRQRGFPCLQQIIFTQLENNGLAITGIYASQYLFERAYGNYLGLCRLGQFVANELGLNLRQMNCYVGKAILEVSNSHVSRLVKALENRLNELGHDLL